MALRPLVKKDRTPQTIVAAPKVVAPVVKETITTMTRPDEKKPKSFEVK
jgi:hypothetical protein